MTEPAAAAPARRSVRAPLHRLAPERAVRRLLSKQLKSADAAGRRLLAGEDPEALHDFRVALRRFRSLERAHRVWLGDALPKKLRKRLARLVRCTGMPRDSEVQLKWLQQQRAALRPAQRAGHHWLWCRLEERQRRGYAALRARMREDFEGLSAALQVALATPSGASPLSFARVTGEQIKPLLTGLREDFAAAGGDSGLEHIHAARLLVKRVRYLLDPVAPALEDGGALLDELGRLQDRLGDIHDAEVLGGSLFEAAEAAGAQRYHGLVVHALGRDSASPAPPRQRGDERAGLVALAQRVYVQMDEACRNLHADLGSGHIGALMQRLGDAADALAPELDPAGAAALLALE